LQPIQEIMLLEIERDLHRRHAEGGGGVFFSIEDWANRFKIPPPVVVREFAELLEQNPKLSVTFEIFGSTRDTVRQPQPK
jgi:hypothetical protein